MATNLSSHFRQQRLSRNLRPGQVAAILGYKSLVGAANQIVRFEETGDVNLGFFKRLVALFGVERATILRLMEQDRRELLVRWSEWANQRITPHLIARLIPNYFMLHPISEDLTTLDEMERHASELASELHQKIWLVVSRKLAIYYNEGGIKRAVQEASPDRPIEPYRLLKESSRRFFSVCDGEDIDLRSIRWPEMRGPRVAR
jgi:hypothetical protein